MRTLTFDVRKRAAGGEPRHDDKTGPAPAALMSLNMLVETVGGRNYTPAELKRWLEEIGYRDIRVVWFEAPGANGAVIGYKPRL